jgi:putative redox protein
MDMIIDFPGGERVDAHFGAHTVATDQPSGEGEAGRAPTPFAVFLASIGTCVGIYALGFCRQRGLSTEGLRIRQHMHTNPGTGMIEKIDLQIELPAGFPEKYKRAIIQAADLCKVKKHLLQPPVFEITTQ